MDEGIKNILDAMAKAAKEGRTLISAEAFDVYDSDVVATFIASTLIKAGEKVRFRFVGQRADEPPHHVFVELYWPLTGTWLQLDPLQFKNDWAVQGTKDL
jgi:hypothetical protein